MTPFVHQRQLTLFSVSTVPGHKVMDHHGVFRWRLGIRFGKWCLLCVCVALSSVLSLITQTDNKISGFPQKNWLAEVVSTSYHQPQYIFLKKRYFFKLKVALAADASTTCFLLTAPLCNCQPTLRLLKFVGGALRLSWRPQLVVFCLFFF